MVEINFKIIHQHLDDRRYREIDKFANDLTQRIKNRPIDFSTYWYKKMNI